MAKKRKHRIGRKQQHRAQPYQPQSAEVTTHAHPEPNPLDRLLVEALAADMTEVMPPDTEMMIDPPGLRKMSDILDELIKPYTPAIDTAEQYQKLITLASVAWNAAGMPIKERPNFLQTFIDMFPADVRRDVADMFGGLIQRRLRLFPDDPRYIVKTKVTDLGDSYHLAVSTLLPPDLMEKLDSSSSP